MQPITRTAAPTEQHQREAHRTRKSWPTHQHTRLNHASQSVIPRIQTRDDNIMIRVATSATVALEAPKGNLWELLSKP